MDELNQGGRPPITDQTLHEWLSKLEPFLKRGLSLYAACLEAQIPRSTVQRKYNEILWFQEEIDRFKNYQLQLYTNIRIKQLEQISAKMANGEKLTKDDYGVLNWMGENTKSLLEVSSKSKIVEIETDNKPNESMMRILNDPRCVNTLINVHRIAEERKKDPNYGMSPKLIEFREMLLKEQREGITVVIHENMGV